MDSPEAVGQDRTKQLLVVQFDWFFVGNSAQANDELMIPSGPCDDK
jgi:hypothetical protein